MVRHRTFERLLGLARWSVSLGDPGHWCQTGLDISLIDGDIYDSCSGQRRQGKLSDGDAGQMTGVGQED